MTAKIILFILALIVVLYVWSYYQHPKQVSILQTAATDFTFDMLREKQPIVIDDRIVSLRDLQQKWFSPNIVTDFRLEHSDIWHKNTYKYGVFHAEQEGDIYLYPVGKKMVSEGDVRVPDPQENLLAVHLLPGQILIVPRGWYYNLFAPMTCHVLAVHDYVTYMLPK